MNKKAKSGYGGTMAVIGIVALCVVAVLGVLYAFPELTNRTPAITGAGGGSPSGGTTNIVTTSTAVSFNSFDALSPGTSVTSTVTAKVNDAATYSTVTTASVGDRLAVLANSSTYHTAWFETTIPNAPTAVIPVPMKANATISITAFNTNGVAMTNGGGATNQTVVAGGQYNMKVRFDGQDKRTSSDMRCIIESTDSTKVDKFVMSGLGATFVGTSKPSSYTLAGTGSAIWVYDVAPVEGAVSPEGTISVISKTGQTLATTYWKLSCYTKEHFIDSVFGDHRYDIEDSAGNAKYKNLYTVSYYFTA